MPKQNTIVIVAIAVCGIAIGLTASVALQPMVEDALYGDETTGGVTRDVLPNAL